MQSKTDTENVSWSERRWQIGTLKSAQPGTRTAGLIEHGSAADGTPIQTPFHLVVGATEGPILYVQAAVHGNEINGIEVLRRVVSGLDPQKMRGAFIAVPITNGPGVIQHERRNWFDEEDMNRVWPGKQNGPASQQIVYYLYEEAVRHAQYVIDLHTASSLTLPHVVYGRGDEASRELAETFALEVLLEEEVSEDLKQARFTGKLRNVLNAAGIAAITPELGGTSRFEEDNIKLGVRGVTNVMKKLGMLEGAIEPPDRPQITVSGSHQDGIRTHQGGIWISQVKPGEQVAQGQVIGQTYSVRTFEVIETHTAPASGFVLGLIDVPMVNIGDRVANICRT